MNKDLGVWDLVEAPGSHLRDEYGLITLKSNKPHILISNLENPTTRQSSSVPIVLSFQVKPTKPWTCGHAYVSLVHQSNPKNVSKEPPSVIRFGVKKCGMFDYISLSIISYDGKVSCHLYDAPPSGLVEGRTSMYTLLLQNTTVVIRRDQSVVYTGDVGTNFFHSPTKWITHSNVSNGYYTSRNIMSFLLSNNTNTSSYPFSVNGVELDVWNENAGVFINNIYFGFSLSDAMKFENETFIAKKILENSPCPNQPSIQPFGILMMLVSTIYGNFKNLYNCIKRNTIGYIYNSIYDFWITEGMLFPMRNMDIFKITAISIGLSIPVFLWLLK